MNLEYEMYNNFDPLITDPIHKLTTKLHVAQRCKFRTTKTVTQKYLHKISLSKP